LVCWRRKQCAGCGEKRRICVAVRVMDWAGEEWAGLYRRWEVGWVPLVDLRRSMGEHAANMETSLSLPHFIIFQSQKFRVYCALGDQGAVVGYLPSGCLISHAANRLAYTDCSPESLTS
jgi:hypothetical protein